MRGLLALVGVLSVLLLAGGAAVVGTMVMRSGARHAAAGVVVLDQPAGTHIVGVASTGAGLAIALQGGGTPDRVVVVDGASVRLAR